MRIKVTLRRVRVTTVKVKKQYVLNMMTVCLYLRHIILSSATCLPPPYFYTLPHKRHDYRKKKLLDTKCVLILATTFV
jgi:hypothetical protein